LDRQRIDKWLWHARVVRTRGAASKLASCGHVRVNGQRIDAASRLVRLDDVITVSLDRQIRILKVVDFAGRRGDAEAGQALYSELTPAPEPAAARPSSAFRNPGAGRPTKRERRAIDRLQGED
jgi:ribosome-associated heat shock protein Hsp15